MWGWTECNNQNGNLYKLLRAGWLHIWAGWLESLCWGWELRVFLRSQLPGWSVGILTSFKWGALSKEGEDFEIFCIVHRVQMSYTFPFLVTPLSRQNSSRHQFYWVSVVSMSREKYYVAMWPSSLAIMFQVFFPFLQHRLMTKPDCQRAKWEQQEEESKGAGKGFGIALLSFVETR